MHSIEIYTEYENLSEFSDIILKTATKTLENHNITQKCHIDISIVKNEEIREINLQYREKDYATDVLSFPMIECKNGEFLEDVELCKDFDTGNLMLGDMIISFEKVLEQAQEFGHSNEREFAFLTVHSVLHLLGYDHEENETDGDIMRAKEKEILENLGIAR
ncbi:MAG: rRNA maturation RNase YbeY [Clostridia bacterium]